MKDLSSLHQLLFALPIVATAAWAVVVLLIEAFSDQGRKAFVGHITLVGLALVGVIEFYLMRRLGHDSALLFNGRVVVDGFFVQVAMIVTAGAFLTVLLSPAYLDAHGIDFGEYYPLLLFSLAGMLVVASAADLMVLLIGIETMSLPIYALCGGWRRAAPTPREETSVEASFKYFIMGGFSTAVSVYGIALVYGATGTTQLAELAALGSGAASKGILILGMVMLLGGLGFKVAAVPFHMWTPDVYEGAPTPITGFMAAAVKATAFAALLRVFTVGFGADTLAFGVSGWSSLLVPMTAATLVLGNLAALWQNNVKRMLAYSSIAHAGYMLIGVAAAGSPQVAPEVRSAIVFYLWAYTFTTIGAFGLIAWIGSHEGQERVTFEDWNGLAQRRPVAALGMTLFMLSLAGVPPTAGFFGKLFVFKAALSQSSLIWLVVLGLLTSVVSVYYYLRIVVAMYFREPESADDDLAPMGSMGTNIALTLTSMAVLLIGLWPSRLWGYAAKAIMGL